MGLETEKNKKKQNNIINAIKHSDYVYAFNDSDNKIANYMKKSNVKSLLKKKKYSLINYSSDMDTSERIKIYNSILKAFVSLRCFISYCNHGRTKLSIYLYFIGISYLF